MEESKINASIKFIYISMLKHNGKGLRLNKKFNIKHNDFWKKILILNKEGKYE